MKVFVASLFVLIYTANCFYDINIVVTVDSSYDMGRFLFTGLKATITSLLKDDLLIMDNSELGVKVGLVLFGQQVHTLKKFRDFNSIEEVIDTVVDLPYLNEKGTDLFSVFKAASDIINEEERKNVPSWIIHFTPEANLNCNLNNERACLLTEQLKRNGTTISIVNVTPDFLYPNPANLMGSVNSSIVAGPHLIKNLSAMLKTIAVPSKLNNNRVVHLCSDNIKSLWLDIVLVIDSSKQMTKQGFDDIIGNILVFLESGFSFDMGKLKHTRFSIINSGDKSEVVVNLSKPKTRSDILKILKSIKYKNDNTMNLMKALESVSTLIAKDDARKNVPNFIVVFSSNTNYDCTSPLSPSFCVEAAILKNQLLTTIVNVDTSLFENTNFHEKGKSIATLGYDIAQGSNYLSTISHFATQANCFCQSDYTQFGHREEKSAECVGFESLPGGYRAAQYSCASLGGFIGDAAFKEKFDFLSNLAEHTSFWVGLNSMNAGQHLAWDTRISYIPYQATMAVDSNKGSMGNCFYRNGLGDFVSTDCSFIEPSYPYFCQISACDADNYCEVV